MTAKDSMTTMSAQPGHFYAVGIGPGSPDLLTLRAAHIIEQCDVLISPQATGSAKSLALEAVRPFLDRQEIIVNSYPMERNEQKTRERWQLFAEDVARRCAKGESVVQITLGDPLIFATSSYLLQGLAELMPAAKIHVISGISAFQTAASRFAETLTLQEDRLTLMSATDLASVEKALQHCETLVLYKAGGVIDGLIDMLGRHNLLNEARLISCGEQGDHELLVANLSSWQIQPLNYMTTMIIKVGNRSWQEA